MASENTSGGPKIMLVAGEASGDQLGGRLMAAIKRQEPGARFIGVGGPRMEGEGLQSLFPMNEMSVMGLTEVIPHIPHLLKRIAQTADFAKSEKPDAVVTIDAPDFSFRVGKKLKGKGIPLIHYVAPSVWAWREGRAKKIAGFLDHLLALLPFEPPYFEKEGLPTTFIGHSAVEERHDGNGDRFRANHGLDANKRLLAVLPGSRNSEVKRLLPVFRQVIEAIARKYPDARIVVPTVSKVADTVTEEMKSWPLAPIVVATDQERHDAFAAADCALAASGTVSLELAISGVPHVIAYQVNAITGWIAKRLIKIDTVTIVNLVLGRKLIPEFLQENCKAKNIIPVLDALLGDNPTREQQKSGFDEACRMLGFGDRAPSEKAAEQILDIIAKK
ncbi:lipid-A-disaccharide synthase [Thalassospira profundimaris]|uniref:Lipid-A-disaccharide synthase n=1 Tax=Thalassospira profundimaris TaxID=502049 RepID=A0A367X0V0_9PROT|nr:lipid-A-disaccharide synthase [Thalassospira profundimaris]RCK47277.1 lipid-A-disaccharide synthase [Thalassospira profundimaris]